MRCRKRPLSDQRPFKCKVCGIGRITKDDLRKHSLVHETKVKEVGGSFKCKDCAKEFTTSVKYERHMLTHSASAASVCLICGKDCRKDSKYSLEEHMNWHAMHPIECTLCEVQLKEASQFNEHKLKHPDERVFRCVAIGSESVLAEEMRKTLAEWHVQDKKEFPCEFCGKTFQRKASRADHVRIHTGEKPHTCSICNRSFTLKNTLKMHMMRHEGIKPHTCETCGKQFLSRFMLNEHKRIHTGEKPFSCDICGKTFSTRPNLCAHVKLHTGARPYQCSYCESAFTSKAKMRMHEDSHRGEIKHFCPYCNKGFIRKDSMISHQRIHRIKRKSCACELCGNRYSSPAALKVHLRKHQVVKPFECSICGKPYTRSDVWKKHLEWHRKRMVPDSHLEVISVPHEAEGGDVQIVVDDDVHIVVDQKTEGGVERVEIPLSVIVNGDNTAMAVPENAEISIIRKNSFGESTIQELHELVTQ
ncbi:hypothetical protein CAPTEDRAFT_178127 [Capitella teleta]|uniref:C2H2-type domain-containing protein n=1 Tax=Capitella teleta TaxID=283909 RepID=R7TLX0_CAPTE|nr:hypothetical protein CAPTEDRAFT_178127 [Capitella teleta]|eukprot:ELT92105.1 hypothetical protein CAPTEDRAFT_178127 [Capitella teleta]